MDGNVLCELGISASDVEAMGVDNSSKMMQMRGVSAAQEAEGGGV